MFEKISSSYSLKISYKNYLNIIVDNKIFNLNTKRNLLYYGTYQVLK